MSRETIAAPPRRRRVKTGFTALAALAGVIAALSPCAALEAKWPRNKKGLRDGLRSVERALAERFEALPMKMIGRVRGGWLEGFGAVFLLEVNVVPMPNLSPFRPAYSEDDLDVLNARKQAGVKRLEEIGLEMLAETAGILGAIPPDEQVALVIALFYFSWEDTSGLPSQLVLQAPRSLLLDRAAGRLSQTELARQVKIRRF